MADPFVLDASVSVAWFLDETNSEHRRYAQDVLDSIVAEDDAFVPDLWHYEIASALVRARRDGSLARGRFEAAKQLLARRPLITVPANIWVVALTLLAERYHLQGYDAVYFHLAVSRSLPIATLDGGIRTACKAHGVRLVRFPQ